MRKIVQIAVHGSDPDTVPAIFALCSDGTVWWCCPYSYSSEWRSLAPIPQDTPTTEAAS